MISHPDLIKAALTADALNLGPHWVYDQPSLSKTYPEGVHQVSDPLSKYHPDKRAGDFTHYGDNLVLMLQSVSEEGGWNADGFADRWQKFWSDTSSYCDGATRATLSHLSDPTVAASRSGDIAGASLALFLTGLIGNAGEEHLIRAVRERTAFSHRDPATLDVAEFFTRVITLLRSRHSLPNALSEATRAEYESLDAAKELERAKAALESRDPLQVASQFGLACST
ncbi:MAG: ADP-ribosylglycohydrolase family protein, partial [Verrucomicrobiota bacterium]